MQSYDQKNYKFFYNWLIFSFFLVFLMIVVGGLTSLTNSGLSITEWELFTGILPPLDNNSWNRYFSLYKGIPQYELINKNMTIDQFKIIFYWEYFHRILGRLIGIFFLFPLLYFHLVIKIDKRNIYICYLILSLIIIQGIVGWFMVESGLVNNITVSHYRLSLHLSIAFVIISLIFWSILNINKKTSKNFFNLKENSFLLFFFSYYNFYANNNGGFCFWFRCWENISNVAVNERWIFS